MTRVRGRSEERRRGKKKARSERTRGKKRIWVTEGREYNHKEHEKPNPNKLRQDNKRMNNKKTKIKHQQPFLTHAGQVPKITPET
ncbi:hypothetical protein E2C01_071835 [Portunus trituberculatus]|uniref:Uncharacterized protein n=1 Tax=Portunus trituberculatus TaxID=210409 RepID=A0A5B7I4Y5_PORTR|nr:hypothetical protein [Portunus trituberculatus]